MTDHEQFYATTTREILRAAADTLSAGMQAVEDQRATGVVLNTGGCRHLRFVGRSRILTKKFF